MNTQEAQNAQGVVLGEFLVGSVLATVLFDSGASHSFISSSFVEKHNIPTVLLKLPLNPYAWGRHTLSARLYSGKDHFKWGRILSRPSSTQV